MPHGPDLRERTRRMREQARRDLLSHFRGTPCVQCGGDNWATADDAQLPTGLYVRCQACGYAPPLPPPFARSEA